MLSALVQFALGLNSTVYGVSVWAKEYENLGWSLVPIPFGRKGPRLRRWNSLPRTPIDPQHTGGLGLRHEQSGTAAVDIDNLSAAADWLRTYGISLEDLLNAPDAVQIDSGRHGHGKLLYRVPEPLRSYKYQVVETDGLRHDVCNFRCVGCQDVLPPTQHPLTGEPYRWRGDFSRLPEMPSALLGLWRLMISGFVVDPLQRDAGMEAQAVNRLPVAEDRRDEALDMLACLDPDMPRDDWVRYGMAFQMMGGRWEDWDEWSSGGRKYQGPHDSQTVWNSFNPARDTLVGPGTLFRAAVAEGYRDREAAPPVAHQFDGVESAPVPSLAAGGGCGVVPLDDRDYLEEGIKHLASDATEEHVDDLVTRMAYCRASQASIDKALEHIKRTTGAKLGTMRRTLQRAQREVKLQDAVARASAADDPGDFEALFGPSAGRLPIIESIKKTKVVMSGSDDEGGVMNIAGNIYTILSEGSGTIYPEFKLNRITGDVEPYRFDQPIEYAGDILTRVHSQVSKDFVVAASRDTVRHAVLDLAMRNQVDPFIDLVNTYQRDPSIDLFGNWFAELTGSTDLEYCRVIGPFLILSLVERNYRPGCKMDNLVVLEGAQGTGKSRLVEALSPDPNWYTAVHIRAGDRLQETVHEMQGMVVVELCEMAGLNKNDDETTKKFISVRVDRFREPYAEKATQHPRRNIFVGTTNQNEYLGDATGNRRYLPHHCMGEIKVDKWIGTWREPLLAQARDLLIDPTVSTRSLLPQVEKIALDRQTDRTVMDPWVDLLETILNGPNFADRKTAATSELLGYLVGTNVVNRAHTTRLASAMRSVPRWVRCSEKFLPDGGPYEKQRVRGYKKII